MDSRVPPSPASSRREGSPTGWCPCAHGLIGVGVVIASVFEVFIAIPFGTVLLEELAFRGTLLGLLRGRATVVPAVAISAVVLGL